MEPQADKKSKQKRKEPPNAVIPSCVNKKPEGVMLHTEGDGGREIGEGIT